MYFLKLKINEQFCLENESKLMHFQEKMIHLIFLQKLLLRGKCVNNVCHHFSQYKISQPSLLLGLIHTGFAILLELQVHQRIFY